MGFKIQNHMEVTQVETRQDTALGIMRWGTNNSFPQTLKNLIEQSPNAKPAVARTAKFYKGAGFEGEDTIVNSYGLTLKQLVSILADDYAVFEAFAIHCNYSIKGQVVSMQPIRITDLRFNEFDELNFASKLGYYENFGRNSEVKKTVQEAVTKEKIKWINRFNPNVVLEQIKKEGEKIAKKLQEEAEGDLAQLAKGVGSYDGQILYFSEAGHSSYPIPPLQAAINFVLSDVENSILVRKESATGFISTYLLKTAMDSEDPNLIALENAIDEAQGARGLGKIITMSGLSQEELNATVLEEIGSGPGGRSTTMDGAIKAFDLARKVIVGSYLIPPILAGADQQTGLTSAELEEAYAVFNAITQNGRDVIESQVNRVLRHSIFDIESIKIKKLKLDLDTAERPKTEKDV